MSNVFINLFYKIIFFYKTAFSVHKCQQNETNQKNFCLFLLCALNAQQHSQLYKGGKVSRWQKFLPNNLKGALKYVIWMRKTENFVNFKIFLSQTLEKHIYKKCRRFLDLAKKFSFFGLIRPGNSGQEDDFKQISCCRSILAKQFKI